MFINLRRLQINFNIGGIFGQRLTALEPRDNPVVFLNNKKMSKILLIFLFFHVFYIFFMFSKLFSHFLFRNILR